MIRRWAKRLAAGAATLAVVGALAVAWLVYCVPVDVAALDPSRGGPLIVTDRHGAVLRQLPSPDGRPGRTAWVPLDRLPALAVETVIASEDARFFTHGGVDPSGIARAVWLNAKERRLGYGGSTITMQLARMLTYPDGRRTLLRKAHVAILAWRLERALDKRQILEQYLNRAYYGNGAVGIEAAAQLYFGKPAVSLSAGEATLLAIVPRAPTGYDPLAHPDAARARRDRVLARLIERGVVASTEADSARGEPLAIARHTPPFRAPHFVDWIVANLPADVRARGGVVTTTLDLPLQELLERRAAEHVAALADRGLRQAGVVVLDTPTGAVRAMVGSPHFAADDGQLNIAAWRRHPGSALKPFVYALALEGGASPASIALDVADVPSEYEVKTITQRERGPVRYREALAGSYNLAAVHVLEEVGVDRLLSLLRRAGVVPDGDRSGPTALGLRLALGAAPVRLVDLAAGYGFLARGGRATRAHGVDVVRFSDGTSYRPDAPPDVRLVSPETAWLVADILSDPVARRPGFGDELPLELPWPVAAKTGTSRGFADTVAIGVTRELTVAAWGGNFDGRPTQGLIAMTAAAPLVRAGFLAAARGPQTLSPRPATLEDHDVCPLSGLRPGPACPHRKREHFAPGTAPAATCTWHRADGDAIAITVPPSLERWATRTWGGGGRAW